MRVMMLAVFAILLTGVLAMSDQTATADEPKKDEKKERPDPGKKESYDEKVTIREWTGTKFIDPAKDVPAFRWDATGKQVIHVMSSKAPKGSEIIDKDDVTWVVTKSSKGEGNVRYTLCYVEKKKP